MKSGDPNNVPNCFKDMYSHYIINNLPCPSGTFFGGRLEFEYDAYLECIADISPDAVKGIPGMKVYKDLWKTLRDEDRMRLRVFPSDRWNQFCPTKRAINFIHEIEVIRLRIMGVWKI